MTAQVFITLLLASLGIVGLGLLALGVYRYPREEYPIFGSARRGLVAAWVLIALGGLLLLATIVLQIWHPATPEASAAANGWPGARATATLPPTPTPPPTPTLEPGWSLRGRPEDGFAVALPADWVELDLDAETMDAALAPIKACCPDIDLTTPFWTDQTIEGLRIRGMKLFALDPDSDPQAVYFGMVSVVRKSLGEGWTLNMAVQTVLDEYKDSGGVALTHERVVLPAGEAEEFQITEGGEPAVLTTKYLFVKDDALWFITLGCEAEYAEAYTPVFEKVPQTFRWID